MAHTYVLSWGGRAKSWKPVWVTQTDPFSKKQTMKVTKKVSLFDYLCYKNEYKSLNPAYVLENCLLRILKKANIHTRKTETTHIPTKGKNWN